MMSTEILPYQRIGKISDVYQKAKAKGFLRMLLSKNGAIFFPVALLLGRASIMGEVMPFGMALYAATLGLNVNRALMALFVILGMITGRANAEIIYISVAAMLLFNAINIPFRKSKPRLNFRYAIIAFISVLIPEIVNISLQGFFVFEILKALLHGFIVFSLVYMFRSSTVLMAEAKKRHIYTNEEMISIAIISVLSLAGIGSISIFGLSIRNILCILMIMLFGYKCGPGVGAAIGVVAGIIISMSSVSTPLIIGSYAFCGLLSGVFKSLGKIGTSLGFVMGNAVFTQYANGSTEVIIYLEEIIFAVIVFMIVPQKLIEAAVGAFNRNIDTSFDKRGYSLRIKEITVEKLNKFSRAFKELSKTFSEISETKVVTEKNDISVLFDRVADKVCKDCSLCLHCWDRNFYNTYQVMFKIVEKLDGKGRIDESDIPEYFVDRCSRLGDFIEAVNNIYEIFKVNMVWKSKIGESRGLVSQQLEGLSKVVSNLASEIDVDVHFKDELEDIILVELSKAGLKPNEAIVFENKWGKYEISIFHKGCGGKRSCVGTIEKLVSDIVGRKMVKDANECCQKPGGKACALKLVEEETFKVTTGVAKVSKNNGNVSGDSYTFMNTGDGKYIIALSDGMGSGQKAATQSRATISMLEQFMDAGFDKDTTVKLINSILILKSSDDSFATIDLSVIDLYSGEAEFVKVGAVPTFIKRDEKVEAVRMTTLPAGILSNIEMELMQKKVSRGEFIIMMSDGVLDSFKKDNEDDKALIKFLDDIKSSNPQEIADKILEEAYENYGGRPEDDMMVVVAKLWKKAD